MVFWAMSKILSNIGISNPSVSHRKANALLSRRKAVTLSVVEGSPWSFKFHSGKTDSLRMPLACYQAWVFVFIRLVAAQTAESTVILVCGIVLLTNIYLIFFKSVHLSWRKVKFAVKQKWKFTFLLYKITCVIINSHNLNNRCVNMNEHSNSFARGDSGDER